MRQESGDSCRECRIGVMRVYSVRPTKDGKSRKQYLICTECRARGKCVFPIDEQGRREYGSNPEELRNVINRQAEQIEKLTRRLQALC